MKKQKFTYEKSGVNINAADNFVKFISSISTKNRETLILKLKELLVSKKRFQH